MSALLLVAGSLALVTGAVHSVLGEVLIFRHLRNGGLVPTMAAPPLRERHVRILWATWHLATVLGWACGGMLLRMAVGPQDSSFEAFVLSAIVFANLGGSLLVLIGTRGRHPGWIALAIVAMLAGFGAKIV
jgi:hypothetical protein